MSLLEVSSMTVGLTNSKYPILRDVSFQVGEGEVVGLVGESGSGKTMASLALIGELPTNVALWDGDIRLGNQSLVESGESRRSAPGDLAMIFQNARASLNPTMRVGKQVARVVVINQGLPKKDANELAVTLLSHVGIPAPDRVFRRYPHQLSGGMCQRVMIAMALACRPKVLIADEPTTALDVTIQAQIFDLIEDLVAETFCGVLFITHDLAAVAEMCDRVVVLYGGQVMEAAGAIELFEKSAHPYTEHLFEAVEQNVDPQSTQEGVDFTLPGCRFAHQCSYVFDRCSQFPPLFEVEEHHLSACFLHERGRIASRNR